MLYNVKDIAELFNVSEKTIHRWIAKRGIPYYKLNDQHQFNRTEVIEWATLNGVKTSVQSLQESSGVLPVRLDDALTSGGVYYNVSGTDKKTVMANAVKAVLLPEGVNRQFFLEALLLREELASTGIGDGIAIPHVRGPIILQVSNPVAFLCFLKQPIDFNALDGQEVSALFILICPTVKSHLQLISRLSFALQEQSFKELIMQKATREKIIEAARSIENKIDKNICSFSEGI